MTDQSDAAASRSAGEPERRQRLWPVVEIAPDVWRLRCVVELQAEIAAIKAERDAALAEVEKLNRQIHIWAANYIRATADAAAWKADAEVARLRAGNGNNSTKDQGE